MTDRWLVTIEAWPHSTGNGAVEDQKQAGERRQDFTVRAIDMAEALKFAEAIAQGMRTNPMVWRAPIMRIAHDREWKQLTKGEGDITFIIWRDDRIWRIYLDADLRDREMERFITEDKEQEYTWSTQGYHITTKARG